jgi:alkyl hydroperoxide reductase subunit AhpC
MIAIGSLAPAFECTAIIDGTAVALSWQQLYRGRVLVLLFDSVESGSNLLDELAAVPDAPAEFERLEATVCVVCRDAMYELLTADVPFPLIVDSDAEIVNLYGMQQPDGTPLWGHCIIDADGFVRRLVQCDVPISSSLAELRRYVAAAGASDFMDMPC